MTPRNILIIIILGLVSSGLFVFFFSCPFSGPDAVQYDRLGYNLSEGHGFSLDEHSPFLSTMFREPGYPAFLAIIYTVFGHTAHAVLIVQMMLHAATAVMTYYLARDIFSERTALFSAIAVAVFPTLANMPAYLLSETFFTFILVLSISVYYTALKGKGMLRFAAAGALLGILALTKMVVLLLLVVLIACTIVGRLARKYEVKRFSINALVLLVVFLTVVSGWAVRNKIACDTFALTVRSGQALWSRAQKVDYPPQKILAAACYNFSEYLGNRLFPDPAHRPERYLYQDLDKAKELNEKYMREGKTESQADALLKKEAIEKISRHPVKCACYTFVEAIKMTAFTYLPLLNEPMISNYFDNIKEGRLLLAILKGMMRLLALPLLLLSLAGILKNRSSWDSWLPLCIVVLYVSVICSLLDAIGRYGVPLIPFYCIFAAAAFYKQVPGPER